jgi:DNA-binding NtrC family response regulator
MKLNALLHLDTDYADSVREFLLEEEIEVHDAPEEKDLLEETAKGFIDIIFLSCHSGSAGDDTIVSTIQKIKELDPRAEIICMGSDEKDMLTIETIKSGATACLSLPLSQTGLGEIIARIRRTADHRKEIYRIETTLNEKFVFTNMVSRNPVMLDIFSLIKRIAPYYRTTLVTGGTGTGKEVLSRALHDLSPRSGEPFIACNCSGLTETLIESELFGHVRGSFTGAIADKKGLFEAAGSGTIFLDEIGLMPLSFQPHLLRVLQDGEYRPVGSTKPVKAQCRVIAATNDDLYEKVRKGEFREDLFFRLAVITIHVPLLKERKEDISLLCYFFLNKLNKKIGKEVRGITMSAKQILMAYNWPGNIRELENVLERAILVTSTHFIRPQDLPNFVQESYKGKSDSDLSLENVEKKHIQRVLMTASGNKSKAALLLGMSRRALQRRIIKYELI